MKFPHKLLISFLIIVSIAAIAGCRKTDDGSMADKPIIVVSILPQQYFVERIASERVNTLVLVGPGQSPHSYEPAPTQMSELAKAKAWVTSGTDFEIGLEPKIAALFTGLRIIHGTDGITFRAMEEHDHEEGEHLEEDEHLEEGEHLEGTDHENNIDRHSWLGREPAKIMAAHIRDALIDIDPALADEYQKNYQELTQEIDETFDALVSSLSPLKGKTVLVFHPSFGYFLDEFGIAQSAIETGGKEPTAKALTELIARAKAERVPAIFVQTQFPVNAARAIAKEAGAQVVPLDPLAPDWLDNIQRMGDALRKAYQ